MQIKRLDPSALDSIQGHYHRPSTTTTFDSCSRCFPSKPIHSLSSQVAFKWQLKTFLCSEAFNIVCGLPQSLLMYWWCNAPMVFLCNWHTIHFRYDAANPFLKSWNWVSKSWLGRLGTVRAGLIKGWIMSFPLPRQQNQDTEGRWMAELPDWVTWHQLGYFWQPLAP